MGVANYRVCRTFTVESGHMLSRHPERCRFPHGHTRSVEVVVSGERLDENGMLVDFKALKLALEGHIDRYDHSMAINSNDPLLEAIRAIHGEDAIVLFENAEPTTEAIAKEIYDFVAATLKAGFSKDHYSIPAGLLTLERVRVWETPSSWAEYGI
jgi:6-pyruvoyltetrahydropterin/6-carboxytetrahydropterin synthase